MPCARTRIALLLTAALATAPLLAQSAPPTPAPQTASGPVPTLKANAQLVVVDVVVTDKDHKPVHGLKAGDFMLTEGGAPQAVKNFEEHTALTAAESATFAAIPKAPPNVFTNYTPQPVGGAVNVLLLDALNTPLLDQAYVQQQLLAYLKNRPPGTRIAIFGLTTRLLLLQGFTSDPDVLLNVLTKRKGTTSPLLENNLGGNEQATMADTLTDTTEVANVDPGLIANVVQFEAEQQSLQLQVRTKDTLDAMNQIARYLSTLPGRKNLIWFSGSFPLNILPDDTLTNPFAVVANMEDEYRSTVDLLARSQVAVYPIDARGLTNSPVFDASNTRNYAGKNGAARATLDENKYSADTAAEHSTMLTMADATGGHAFVNTNGLTAAVATAIDDGSNFYTLAYTPANPKSDGSFRKIKVELARSGLTLSYRKGYFANDPDKAKGNAKPMDAAVTSDGSPNLRDTMRIAMTRGAPAATEILLSVGVVPITPPGQPEEKLAPGNTAAPTTHGPYRRYGVNYAIKAGDLLLNRTADGKVHADYAVLIYVYDPDGALVNSLSNTVSIAATVDDVSKLAGQGIFHHEEISAPAKGEYFFRIAVRDLHRDRFGAVEVATSSVKNVVSPTAASAGSAAPASK